jgi:hypothetical protein
MDSFTVVFRCFLAYFFVTNRPVSESRYRRGALGFASFAIDHPHFRGDKFWIDSVDPEMIGRATMRLEVLVRGQRNPGDPAFVLRRCVVEAATVYATVVVRPVVVPEELVVRLEEIVRGHGSPRVQARRARRAAGLRSGDAMETVR